MRKRFLLSLLVALLTTIATHAYDFQSGDLYYNITSDNTVEVTYQEQWSESNYQGLTTATIPATVIYNGTTFSVTSIGEGAFEDCSSLTSITLPNSVTSIGEAAFYYCSSLTSITLPNSVTSIGESAFAYCSSLTSIPLPNSVTSIGGRAFWGCSSLTSITIPNSVTRIGYYAFENCSSLTSIVVESGNTMYDSRENCNAIIETASNTLIAGGQSTTIPNSVTSIGEGAFYGCSSLTSITIPNSVTSIGEGAFYGCSSLTSITIPNSVTRIGSSAFSDVPNVVYSGTATGTPWGARSVNGYVDGYFVYADDTKTHLLACSAAATGEITLPNSVTSIGGSAFGGCSSLTSIIIPNSVTSIGDWAFALCSSLTSITLPNSVTSIGQTAFFGCSSLTSLTLPNSVTSIGSSAFSYCSSLTSLTLPNSVTSIGSSAFSYCSSLTSITLPNSVTSIGDWAFEGCTSLTSITLPNSVTSIGDGAFYGCTSLPVEDNLRYADTYLVEAVDKSLSTYTIKAGTKWVGGSGAFANCSSLTSITIPNSVTSIGWSAFANCSSLTSINIPNSVTSIGRGAFWECSSLTSITIPNSVTSIGDYAFEACSSLTSVTSLSCTPPSCGSNVFNYTPSEKTLVVPNIDAYKNSSTWKDFTYFKNCLSVFVQSSNSTMGVARIEQDVDCDSVAIISATANYGYHFTQWIDGNTDNPRTITLTQDTTFTAEFAPNQYTLTTTTNYAERGTAQGDTIADYLSELQVSATANYGYHFTQWSDGNTDNPRTISLTKDINVVALFDKNQYTITTSCNTEQGTISGTKVAEYLDKITLNVLPNVGWHFTQWTDSNTDNPRTFTLTQDTTFAAEFAMDYSGKCGDDLYWAYSNQEIKITGTGAMYNYTDSTMPWTLLRDSIKTVRIGNNATSIGEYAFSNTPKLAELHIGTNVENIGANAFSGCRRLYDIYCNPTYPPFAETNSFANYNVYVHVPCASLDAYDMDVVFGSFKYVECIGAEDTVITDKTVTVVPGDADATFTWPVTDNADTYSLVIAKDGVTFCTLVFNAQGQLVSIAFKPRRQNAPAAEGTTPATYAEMTANGFRFTVTGLNEGSAYAYTLTVRNAANTVLETYTGDFTTLSNTPTGINESAGEDAHAHGQVEKILRDGQVLILRNGVAYDMMGQTR